METIGALVYRALCKREYLEECQRTWQRSPLNVDGLSFQVFTTGKPNLQFNVTLKGDRCPTIKFEEQSRPGTFAVGVASEDGATIVYKRDNMLGLDDPLDKLIKVFPDCPRMKKFVECLINSK